MKNTSILILCITLFGGCSQSNDFVLHDNINEYQGVWRDTLYENGVVYIEDFIISKESMLYTLSNAYTHVVYDKLIGKLILGNENKMEWNCISSITNKIRIINWNVLYKSAYQMRLYSNLQGEHVYKRVYNPSIDDYTVKDVIKEMLQYSSYLPLSKDELASSFGFYNRLGGDNKIEYLMNHPFIEKIRFNENYDNDSIYSYSLSINNWMECEPIVDSLFTKIRTTNGMTEYCDAGTLEYSNNVIMIDPVSHQMSFYPIKDYDYWPNVSHYIGMATNDVKKELEKKYVYTYHMVQETGLFEYNFHTAKDSVCSSIKIVDSLGVVKYCDVALFKQYMKSKLLAAQEELQKISILLKSKYFYNREETDEKGNKVYYFYPCMSIMDSAFEVKLYLDNYQNGVSNLYCVAIRYSKF